MNKRNYIIYQADPESTVGLAIAAAIEVAKGAEKKVVICLRDAACVVTRDTKLSDGISSYRKNVERFARIRN